MAEFSFDDLLEANAKYAEHFDLSGLDGIAMAAWPSSRVGTRASTRSGCWASSTVTPASRAGLRTDFHQVIALAMVWLWRSRREQSAEAFQQPAHRPPRVVTQGGSPGLSSSPASPALPRHRRVLPRCRSECLQAPRKPRSRLHPPGEPRPLRKSRQSSPAPP